jgi:hypothetical protein
MNIYVRDASSGATIAAMSADMRGNTDETWSRTLNWLVHNRLLAPGYSSTNALCGMIGESHVGEDGRADLPLLEPVCSGSAEQ